MERAQVRIRLNILILTTILCFSMALGQKLQRAVDRQRMIDSYQQTPWDTPHQVIRNDTGGSASTSALQKPQPTNWFYKTRRFHSLLKAKRERERLAQERLDYSLRKQHRITDYFIPTFSVRGVHTTTREANRRGSTTNGPSRLFDSTTAAGRGSTDASTRALSRGGMRNFAGFSLPITLINSGKSFVEA